MWPRHGCKGQSSGSTVFTEEGKLAIRGRRPAEKTSSPHEAEAIRELWRTAQTRKMVIEPLPFPTTAVQEWRIRMRKFMTACGLLFLTTGSPRARENRGGRAIRQLSVAVQSGKRDVFQGGSGLFGAYLTSPAGVTWRIRGMQSYGPSNRCQRT